MFTSANESDLSRKLISKLHTGLENLKGNNTVYCLQKRSGRKKQIYSYRWTNGKRLMCNSGKQFAPYLGGNMDGKTLQDIYNTT